jgi:hypothetical protein
MTTKMMAMPIVMATTNVIWKQLPLQWLWCDKSDYYYCDNGDENDKTARREVVRANFSALRLAVFLMSVIAWHRRAHSHLESKARLRFCPASLSLPMANEMTTTTTSTAVTSMMTAATAATTAATKKTSWSLNWILNRQTSWHFMF